MKKVNPITLLIPFWIFTFLFKLGAGLHYAILPAIGGRLFPIWLVGLIISVTSFIQLTLDVPAGFLLDRFGYIKLLRVSAVIFSIAAGLLIFGLTPLTYILSVSLSALGWLFFGPGVNAYIISKADPSNAEDYISLRDTFGSLGTVFGLAFLPILLTMPVNTIGAIIAIIIALAALIISKAPKDNKTASIEKKIGTQSYYIRRDYIHKVIKAINKLNPASWLLVIQNFSSAFFYAVIWFVIPLIITNPESKLFGVSLSIFDFSIIVLGFIFGKIAHKINHNILIPLGLIIFAIMGTIVGFNNGWLFIIFGFLATSGDEISSISLWAWLNRLDKSHAEDGAVSGAITLFQDLGWTLGPVIAGILYNYVGASWTIALGASIIFITFILSVIIPHRRRASLDIVHFHKKPTHHFHHK